MTNVCFDRTFLILAIIVIFTVALYQFNQYRSGSVNNCPVAKCPPNVYPATVYQQPPAQQLYPQQTQFPQPEIINQRAIIQSGPPDVPADPVREYDYRNINDVLTGPIKRPPRDTIGPVLGNPLFNIYTQGPPDNYSWLGLLLTTDTSGVDTNNKMLKLFGRQRYPNSNSWDYYVVAYVGGNDKVKISLCKDKYRKELYDGDSVTISELNMDYQVKLNRNDYLSYNPYII